jgi:hypothetical protein
VINDPLHAGSDSHDRSSPDRPSPTPDRRGFAVVFVLAVGILVVLFNVGASKSRGATASTKPRTVVSTPADGSVNPAGSGSAANPTGSATTTTAVAPTDQSFAPAVVTRVVTVTKIASNGDLEVTDASGGFTISMASKPKIVDLAGKSVASDVIQVGLTVQVTGLLEGSNMTAQNVIIPTQ